ETDFRPYRQVLYELDSALPDPLDRGHHPAVDGRGQVVGKSLLARGAEEVEVGHEHAVASQRSHGAHDQRGLAVTTRGDDDHVLASAKIGIELRELISAVRERLASGDLAVAEWVVQAQPPASD